MHLKMSSAKWRPFCLGLVVLIHGMAFNCTATSYMYSAEQYLMLYSIKAGVTFSNTATYEMGMLMSWIILYRSTYVLFNSKCFGLCSISYWNNALQMYQIQRNLYWVVAKTYSLVNATYLNFHFNRSENYWFPKILIPSGKIMMSCSPTRPHRIICSFSEWYEIWLNTMWYQKYTDVIWFCKGITKGSWNETAVDRLRRPHGFKRIVTTSTEDVISLWPLLSDLWCNFCITLVFISLAAVELRK